MQLTEAIQQYQMEREQLLERLVEMLRQDERVESAWVFGSLGRGQADALSDIDLIVVAGDDRLQEVIAERFVFAERLGQPLFCLEAPQNAPPGGGYLMICCDRAAAPHIVDVYWQGESLKWDAAQARRLFMRSHPLPAAGSKVLPRLHSGAPSELAGAELPHPLRFFWMMFLIVAKYAWRNPQAGEMHLLPVLLQAYVDSRSALGDAPELEPDILSAPVGEPAQKLSMLRTLAARMRILMEPLRSQAGEHIFQSAERYLAMVAEAIDK